MSLTFAHVLSDWRRSRDAMKSGNYGQRCIWPSLLPLRCWTAICGTSVSGPQPQVPVTRMAPSPKAVEDFEAIFVRPHMDKGRARAIFAGNPDRHGWGLSAVPAAAFGHSGRWCGG